MDHSVFNAAATVWRGETHVFWEGDEYPVPSMEELEIWVYDSVCETPEGEIVEPDHPSSWLSILGLI